MKSLKLGSTIVMLAMSVSVVAKETCGINDRWIDVIKKNDYAAEMNVPSPCKYSKNSKAKQLLCSNKKYEELAWTSQKLVLQAESNATKVRKPKFNKAYWGSSCQTESCLCQQLKNDFEQAHDTYGGIQGIDFD
ncbi:hypothetical protein [Hydromonas duriensis]|uniref:Uncharacterized protein n=1 Tax=Hydromonas duriensis TaxID=1527608 RepID=A0A4R6Y5P0_9BURK|nr:hypothetical protein [Hydromonas duriensis]TDR28903.1 hypothetical protein DFR44_1313 [Hydromonas duriensis]